MSILQEKVKNFSGLKVVSFESRLADVMREGLFKKGAEPIIAPSMREIPLEQNPEITSFGKKLIAGQIDVLICLTGVGVRLLIESLSKQYSLEKILQALGDLTLVARGPKPVRVLREYEIPITLTVPEPNTWREILEELDYHNKSIALDRKMVAVQEYGVANEELIRGLKNRSAKVLRVPIYRWGLPEDRTPLESAIRQIVKGEAQVVLITSAQQIRHVMQVASEMGAETELKQALKKMVVSSVGPTATEAVQEFGLSVDFEPSHPKMGHLIAETAQLARELLEEKQNSLKPTVSLQDSLFDESERQKRKESVFIRACYGKETSYTPIWLMRQAGRYMKEYRRIRNKVSFMELCRNKELVAEVTITAAEKLKVDAAIIFSDLLLIVEPLGLKLQYEKNEGPAIYGGVASQADIDRLQEIHPQESLAYVFDAIRLTRSSMPNHLPLIGFSGAPFTLASYILEGGSSRVFAKTKTLMYSDPGAWKALMEKISRGLIQYLHGQIEAGVDALQIFDSWVGCLNPSDYRQYVLPYTKKIIKAIQGTVPVIHFGTGTASFLKEMREAGGEVIGVDFRIDLNTAWEVIGKDRAIQGNLDPLALYAPREMVLKQAQRVLDQAGGHPGHIFNLGHGILPTTPVEHVMALVDYVHEASAKK